MLSPAKEMAVSKGLTLFHKSFLQPKPGNVLNKQSHHVLEVDFIFMNAQDMCQRQREMGKPASYNLLCNFPALFISNT